MKIRKTISGSNGAKFKSTYGPFKVIIEDGITTVYLTKEDAISLKNDIKFKTSWWNAPYKTGSDRLKMVLYLKKVGG